MLSLLEKVADGEFGRCGRGKMGEGEQFAAHIGRFSRQI
jgi:hypothetical protein